MNGLIFSEPHGCEQMFCLVFSSRKGLIHNQCSGLITWGHNEERKRKKKTTANRFLLWISSQIVGLFDLNVDLSSQLWLMNEMDILNIVSKSAMSATSAIFALLIALLIVILRCSWFKNLQLWKQFDLKGTEPDRVFSISRPLETWYRKELRRS